MIMKKLCLFFMVILLSGCDYYDDSLKITNRSKTDITIQETNHQNSISFNNIEYYLSTPIKPDSTLSLSINGKVGAWHRYIQNSPQKKLLIYIFSIDTLSKYKSKYTMYDLYVHDKYIKRFEFTEKQLDDIHWNIVFNPD
jgi:hypothetical protein